MAVWLEAPVSRSGEDFSNSKTGLLKKEEDFIEDPRMTIDVVQRSF